MGPIIIESKIFCRTISLFMPIHAVTFFPFIICRNKNDAVIINHESIHIRQQLELLIIPFFIIYILNWIYNIIIYKGDGKKAYFELFFEKEAYLYEYDLGYLNKRKSWSYFRPNSRH